LFLCGGGGGGGGVGGGGGGGGGGWNLVREIKTLFTDLEARFVLLQLNCLNYK